jgi:hypothetical protein
VTYGGESWNKKGARIFLLDAALRKLAREGVTRLRPPVCMVLAGPDAADVRFLRANGVPPSNIIAVDTDPIACETARRVEPGCVVHEMDVVEAARLHRESVDLLVLDLCAQLGEPAVELFARVAGIACRSGAVAIAAFSYGRELPARMATVSGLRTFARERVKSRAGILAARELDAHSVKMSRLETFMYHARRAFQKRLHTWIGAYESPVVAFYASTKTGRGSTPMMYVSGILVREPMKIMTVLDVLNGSTRVERIGGALHGPVVADEHGRFYCAASKTGYHMCKMFCSEGGEAAVRAYAVHLRGQGLSSAQIADHINMSPGVVAAWLAVHTRTQQGERDHQSLR